MKLRWLPVVASICGVAFCASVAQAQSVYVHNKPISKSVISAGTTYVPFNDLMRALHRGWTIDNGVVTPSSTNMKSEAISGESFTLAGKNGKVNVQGMIKDGALWVPVRVAKDLGFEVIANKETQIIDIIVPHKISDADRAAQAEVDAKNAQKAADLAAKEDAYKEAMAERKAAMAELKAKREKGSAAEEGAYPEDLDKSDKGEAKAEASESSVDGVVTYADYQKVQKEMDEKAAAKRRAESAERLAAKQMAGGDESEEAEVVKDVPVPNVIVFAPQAIVDYFSGHINMCASVKNIGTAEAKSLRAKLTLLGPDGSVWNTRTVSSPAIAPNGAWSISEGYDHPSGSEIMRGNCTLKVDVDYANKPAK